MMVEVLGTRFLAPFYGVSLYVWSAQISVALTALAIGYWLGGRLADQESPLLQLPGVVGLAGLLMLPVPLIEESILLGTNALGIRAGSLASSLILFGGPLTLLGMTGPLIVRRCTTSLGVVGVTTGTVFAVSTAGSVVGTLLVGFFLLPMIGASRILAGLGATLLGLAVVLRFGARTPISVAAGVSAALLAGTVVATGWSGRAGGAEPARFTVLHDSASLYGRIRVLDDSSSATRWLLSDSSIIGAESHGESELPFFVFLSILETLPAFRPDARTALLVGLGAGYLPGALERYGITTDVIELDPGVASAAQTFFGFRPPGRLVVGDGRFEIRKIERRYDFVIEDCFTGGSNPTHLLTVEALSDLRDRLVDGGILALNFVGFAHDERASALASVQRTIDVVFPHRRQFVAVPGTGPIETVIFASSRPIEMPTQPTHPRLQRMLPFLDLLERDTAPGEAVILTDDYNPLETLQLPLAEGYRQLMLERLGAEILAH